MGQSHFGNRNITNMNLLISILLLIASSCLADNSDRSDRSKIADSLDNSVSDKTNERDKKVFSLFTIVNFPNDQCTAKSDNTLYGTCYTASECASKGGTADGNCAAGFGACCTFTLSTCGTSVSQNITYIQNPSYPTGYTTTGSCAFSVTPLSSNICQLRLDFDIVETTTGVCTDSLTIAGPTGRNPMDLCGTLTGLHVYIEQGRSTTATTLTFTTASTSGITWKAKVTQIECSSLARGPPDCNQYYTGVSGYVTSYNWPNIQLVSKTHNICIRRELGYCGIQYQAYAATSPDSYILDAGITITSVNGVAAGTANDGYLLIPGGPGAADVYSGGILCDAVGILCGGTAIGVSGAIYREGHTFVLTHGVTADNVAGALGFKLAYAQLPCQGAGVSYTTGD